MVLREIGLEWDSRWEELAGHTPASGFMQSTQWAAFKRLEGYRIWRAGLFETEDEGAELIGGAILMLYPSGYAGSESLIICPEGPVLPWHDTDKTREGLRLLIAFAREIAREHGGLGLRIEPHLPPPRPSVLRNWTRSPIDLTPVHTPVIDLCFTDEEIIARMQPKGRYNLKLADRHGVTVRRSTRTEDLAEFYAIFNETAGRGGFFREPYGFFLNLASVYFPTGDAALYFADYDSRGGNHGEALSVILVIYYGRRATYLYGGSLPRHRNVMPGYALHRAAWREARERGCIEYDLYGYDPFARPDHPYAGFSRFKQQFRPRRIDSIGAHDSLFYDRVADLLIDRLS